MLTEVPEEGEDEYVQTDVVVICEMCILLIDFRHLYRFPQHWDVRQHLASSTK